MTARPVNAGDLARVISHDQSDTWPMAVEIVAYWPDRHGKKGRRRSIEIPADQFFGTGAFGAPIPGEVLIGMVEKLRKMGPEK